MSKLILIRHGQSLWNLENRFTGWVDVPLTEQGYAEARKAADRMRGIRVDVAYTSALSRAQETLRTILDKLGLQVPVIRDQALNERHYGSLQGLNKEQTAEKYGAEQVHIWRRSFDVPPPGGEALKNTAERTLPFFENCILGDLKNGRNVLVVAHGNSNRSIVMKLENMTPEQILSLELGTGVPRIYEIDPSGSFLSVEVSD